jgi:hypothetical protein
VVIEEGSLPPGCSEGYFDADWLPAGGSGELPMILVTAGELRTTWNRDAVPLGHLSAKAGAALSLAAAAKDALAALDHVAGPIDVIGDGLIAQLVREGLGERFSSGSSRPAAVVDCTGDHELVLGAVARVDDLGVVVLAGPPPGEPLVIDLYPDVHLRGLRVVGVAPSLTASALVGTVPKLSRTTLREVTPDGLGGDVSSWYRLSARTDPGTP